MKNKYPEKTTEQKGKGKRPSFGCGSVKVVMSKDFDESLEEFRDYM